jgi:CRISPR/Cas system-associated exonuclease Cas4 (RecB family)
LVRERLLGEGQLLRQLWTLFQEENTGFRPWQSEMDLSADMGDVRISGKVDAVWRNADTDALAVVDFKTGKWLPERREIDKFERIQLLLYCLAVEQQWPQNEVAGALYIHLPVLGEPKRKVVLATPSGKASLGAGRTRPLEWNTERREALITHVQTWVAGIRSGMFEAMPLPMRCRSCEFRLICRYPRRWESY